MVQSARGQRTGLPSEASPPGPLSVTGEGETGKARSDSSPSPVRERGPGGEASEGTSLQPATPLWTSPPWTVRFFCRSCEIPDSGRRGNLAPPAPASSGQGPESRQRYRERAEPPGRRQAC